MMTRLPTLTLYKVGRINTINKINAIYGWNFATHTLDKWDRSYYKYFLDLQTRVTDNDVFGHVNNAVYYSYFDTIINHYLCYYGGQDLNDKSKNTAIPYCVSSSCTFKKPLTYPQLINAGYQSQNWNFFHCL